MVGIAFYNDFKTGANLKEFKKNVFDKLTNKIEKTIGFYTLEQTESEAAFYKVDFEGKKEKVTSTPVKQDTLIKAGISQSENYLLYIDQNYNIQRYDFETKETKEIRSAFPYSEKTKNSIKPTENIVYNDIIISPNGKKVAVYWSGYDFSAIGLMDADGSNWETIQTSIVNQNSFNKFSWAPDSKNFVISCTNNDINNADGCLYYSSISAYGEGLQILPTEDKTHPNKIKDAFTPIFSSSSKRILYSYRYKDAESSNDKNAYNYTEIYSIAIDGSNKKQISDNKEFAYSPFYIGSDIIYALSTFSDGEKGIINLSGSKESNIFNLEDYNYYEIIDVSPDSNYITIKASQRDSSRSQSKKSQTIIFDLQANKSILTNANSTKFVSWITE